MVEKREEGGVDGSCLDGTTEVIENCLECGAKLDQAYFLAYAGVAYSYGPLCEDCARRNQTTRVIEIEQWPRRQAG
jgi:hypothetical protein